MLGIKNVINRANDASIMYSNSGVGCGVSSGKIGSGSVNEIVAKGPKDVLNRYFPHEWQNCPLYGGGGGGSGVGGYV